MPPVFGGRTVESGLGHHRFAARGRANLIDGREEELGNRLRASRMLEFARVRYNRWADAEVYARYLRSGLSGGRRPSISSPAASLGRK